MKAGLIAWAAVLFVLALDIAPALAVDGVIEINSAVVAQNGFFPYSISASGSYRLTGNLNVPAGIDGIDVTADNVTIDLNGFTIIGAGGAGGNGISSSNNQVTVHNGSVIGMGGNGIALGKNATVADVQAIGNGGIGIAVGDGSIVRHNTASGNTGVGISVTGSGGSVIENTMMNNTSYGLKVKDTTTGIAFNVLTGNSGNSTPGSPTGQLNGNGTPNELFNNVCNGTACTGS
jgi:parallel beta-helix repeat protein